MLRQAIIFASVLVALAQCYTLKAGGDIAFPVQLAISSDAGRFRRYRNDELELLTCPDGFDFDGVELKCRYSPSPRTNDLKPEVVDCNVDGLNAYPMSCRKFLNCFNGVGHVQTCASHLLFHERQRNCDWPEMSNCCEYKKHTYLNKL